MGNPLALVVGAGPGVSGSLARLLGRQGYDVALVGLDIEVLARLGQELQGEGINAGWTDADVTDPEALTAAIDQLVGYSGRLDLLHFNPSAYREKTPLELSAEELLADLALGAGALLTAVQAARPFLRAGGRVTATGSIAADRPAYRAASLGAQKAALRNLVRSLDSALAPDGIRAVSVTVTGVLDRDDPSSPYHPDQVAAAIVAAARQDVDEWRSEVRHLTAG
jgi:NAD(P)-dependent dehydrogenase (short-subunit alcohol dehydrogenase family)